MLKSIIMVTILVTNLSETEAAYTEYLNYQVVDRGVVSQLLADNWQTPSLHQQPFSLMQPASDKNVYLRFVQDPYERTANPMRRTGWNATEILVEDPDALAQQFRDASDSPFTIIGEPDFLTDKQNVKAMQVLGPSGELVYLTNIIDPAKSAFDLGRATAPVDRVFIMVLGTHDMASTLDWYQANLTQPALGPFDYKISVLSNTWGLPSETLYGLSLMQLPGQFMLEIDEYPPAAKTPQAFEQQPPPGILMVSFFTDELDNIKALPIDPANVIPTLPYGSRESMVVRGNSGELLELIEEN